MVTSSNCSSLASITTLITWLAASPAASSCVLYPTYEKTSTAPGSTVIWYCPSALVTAAFFGRFLAWILTLEMVSLFRLVTTPVIFIAVWEQAAMFIVIHASNTDSLFRCFMVIYCIICFKLVKKLRSEERREG